MHQIIEYTIFFLKCDLQYAYRISNQIYSNRCIEIILFFFLLFSLLSIVSILFCHLCFYFSFIHLVSLSVCIYNIKTVENLLSKSCINLLQCINVSSVVALYKQPYDNYDLVNPNANPSAFYYLDINKLLNM